MAGEQNAGGSHPVARPGAVAGRLVIHGEPETSAEGSLPPWFELLVIVIISGVLAFGSIGLLFAFFGRFSVIHVFPVAAALTIALVLVAQPVLFRSGLPGGSGNRRSGRGPRRVQLPAVAACGVATVSAVVNGALDGKYVYVDRDPGVYATTAKWLAARGTLEVPAGTPWLNKGAAVSYKSAGMYLEGHGRLEFQFAHFVPVLMAEGQKVGGDRLMFATPAVIGALSLLVVYAVGCRTLQRPWLSLAAITMLAVSLPEAMVSRSSYSETATQLLLLGAVWALVRAHDRLTLFSALFAGLVVGAVETTRIDALVYLIPVPLALSLAWLAADKGRARRRVGWCVLVVVVSLVPGVILGDVDVTYRAGGYYAALRGQVDSLRYAVGLVAVLAVVLALVWPRIRHAAGWPALRRRALLAGPPAVVVALLLLWAVRPAIYHPHGVPNSTVGGLQAREGLPVDLTRTYAEQSINWLSWYFGPITVAFAILGIAAMVGGVIRRRSPASLLMLAMTGFGAALYIWAPSITPEQIWSSRRFVPAGLPLLVIACAAGIEAVTDVLQVGVPARWVARVFPAGVALTAVAFTASATWPVHSFRTQQGFNTVIDKTCTQLGPDAAVVFDRNDPLGLTLQQTLRSFCDVPVARADGTMTKADVSRLAGQWAAQGITLWVLASTEAGVRTLVPPSAPVRQIASATSTHEFQRTLSRIPSTYVSATLTLFGASVRGAG